MDDITVIIPTFNRKGLVIRAIDSALNQTLAAKAIIVVDDGSHDQTAATLETRYGAKIQIARLSQNRGVSSARNLGARLATGRWLAFLDADDEWLPQKLARQCQLIASHQDAVLVHCNEIWIRNGTRVNEMRKHQKAGGDQFHRATELCVISPSATLLRRDVFYDLGGFDESLAVCEDYDLWLRVTARYPVHFCEDALLKKYGGHQDQLSRLHWGMDRFRIQALRNLLKSHPNLSRSQRQQVHRQLVKRATILASGAHKRGKQAEARYYTDLAATYARGSGCA